MSGLDTATLEQRIDAYRMVKEAMETADDHAQRRAVAALAAAYGLLPAPSGRSSLDEKEVEVSLDGVTATLICQYKMEDTYSPDGERVVGQHAEAQGFYVPADRLADFARTICESLSLDAVDDEMDALGDGE